MTLAENMYTRQSRKEKQCIIINHITRITLQITYARTATTTTAIADASLPCAYFVMQNFRLFFLSFFLFVVSTFYSSLGGDPIITHRMRTEAIHFS
jgi:hypothetical protein